MIPSQTFDHFFGTNKRRKINNYSNNNHQQNNYQYKTTDHIHDSNISSNSIIGSNNNNDNNNHTNAHESNISSVIGNTMSNSIIGSNNNDQNNSNHTININAAIVVFDSKCLSQFFHSSQQHTTKRRKIDNYSNDHHYNAKDHTHAKLRYSDDIIAETFDITTNNDGTFGKYLIKIINLAATKWKLDVHCIVLHVHDEIIGHDDGNKLDCVLQKIPPNTAIFDVCIDTV